MRVLYSEIYDATAWVVRLPYALAKPVIVRTALKQWVRGLPLDDAVRERVLARIDAPDLVDEIVPFLIAVKETYTRRDDAVETFDAYLRRTWSPDEDVPGMEHALFAWQPPDAAANGSSPPKLDPETTARIVAFYDALYLGDGNPAPTSEVVESCARGDDREALRRAVDRSTPSVRALLEDARSRLALEDEYDRAVRATLDDPKRLETVTTTAIEFIDHLVCASYRVFATEILREQQLRDWMRAELARPGGGDLWRYLEGAGDERRYAVLVVVDGLQGHLVEALAAGRAASPFLAVAAAEQRAAAATAPATQRSEPAPPVQTAFFEAIARDGFSDPRYLPFFRDLYDDGGPDDDARPYAVARVGIATTPTISVRNLPMVKTGATVAGAGGTGIPNFHFVDRTYRRHGESAPEASGRPYYFFGNDAMQLGRLTRAAGMRSLFDRMPDVASFSCAAQYDDAAHYRVDALVNLAVGEAVRDFAETLCMTELRRRAANELRLRTLRGALLDRRAALAEDLSFWRFVAKAAQRDERALAERDIDEIAHLEQRTLPELLVFYDPWPDHFAHFQGPFGDAILAPSGELNRLDYWLRVLTSTYREAGVADRTLFAMAGDHGLVPVHHLLNPEVEVFDALRTEGVDLRVAKISSDEGEGPKLNSAFDPPRMRGYDAVVASTAGGNYMIDFFVDQDDGWTRQPIYRELVGLQVGPARDGRPRAALDVVDAIVTRLSESLDYLVVRESACDADGGRVRVVGVRPTPRGDARVDAFVARVGDRIHYRSPGVDLLETDRPTPYDAPTDGDRRDHAALRRRCIDEAREEDPTTWCRERAWRRLTSYTARPDSVVQLAHLYDVDRAGTVNLFPKHGIAYNSRVPGRHAGELFHEKDAFVGLWGDPVARGPERGRIRTLVNGSAPIAVYEYLSGERAIEGRDGWGFPSIADEVFEPAP